MAVHYLLVPLMAIRAQIDDALSQWYYNCLPVLGVNCTITREWRRLPVGYHGLGLPNHSLEKLADSIKFLQCHWGSTRNLDTSLRCSFELIQMETGLRGIFC